MCKILVLTNTEKIKNIKTVSEVIASHLQDDQPDGYGYAFVGEKGLYGERTIAENFISHINKNKTLVPKDIINVTYNDFGTLSKPTGGAIFHGRTSTNVKGLLNTHPINKNGLSLIHNGVVTNHGEVYKKDTSNDSEDLVQYLSTEGISGIEKNLTGYYAIGAIDPQLNLHVIRDSSASLYVACNTTLGCLIFGTTEELIENVAKDLKWKIDAIEQVKGNIHLIFNSKGDIISNNPINPRGWTTYESKWADRSLGYNLTEKYYESKEWSTLDNEDDYYDLYKNEISNADASYKFYDWNGREMEYAEFMACDEMTKYDCTVTRADGTVVDPKDYYRERLA